MAEAAALVWVRGPGLGCQAVRCASASCSVRDVIRRHCQDQVGFALPGRRETAAGGAGRGGQGWVTRVWRGRVSSLGLCFWGCRPPSVKVLRAAAEALFCFCVGVVVVLSPSRAGSSPSALRRSGPALGLDSQRPGALFLRAFRRPWDPLASEAHFLTFPLHAPYAFCPLITQPG